MRFEHLLAKSHGKILWPEKLLSGHLYEVLLAAEQLVDATGKRQLAALGVDPETHFSRFRQLARLAAALHDLGKANDHFLEMLARKKPQGLRHEWVSLLMVRERLTDWLTSKIPPNDLELALWAVAGHHPKYGRPSPPCKHDEGAGPKLTILWNHPQFGDCLEVVRRAFDLPTAPTFAAPEVVALTGGDNAFGRLKKWLVESEMKWEKPGLETKAILAALKNTLVGADVAGSALPSKVSGVESRRRWIGDAFAHFPDPADLEAVVHSRLKGKPPRPFQLEIGASSASITLVTAGCGSGKTVGAYLWAARQHPGKRLYFCYPTTGTATEGYRGYLHVQEAENLSDDQEAVKRLNARLFHSRREVDFEVILQTGGDDDSDESRIEALEAWHTPVVACTCDTVLGVIQSNRKGLFGWPSVAGSAIVFDEIHSYDDRLFGALMQFIQNARGIPVLLMTASLPKGRLAMLRRIAAKCGREINAIGGPEEVETIPRYRLEETPNDLPQRIREEIASGGKVLWVSNTVNRVIDSADRLENLEPMVYHSRYKYGHRVIQHRDVVAAFDVKCKKSVIACCSQVAEMSLDLNGCTLLLTDLAPVPALIQRLGRLNRDAEKGSLVRPFIVIEPENELPYSVEELDEARKWLNGLAGRDLHQRDLVAQWTVTDHSEEPEMIASAWLDGGPCTTVLELRDGSNGVTVLMASDEQKVKAGEKIGLFTLPMPMPMPPKGVDWRSKRHKGIPVVADEAFIYDAKRGARWKK